MFDPTDDSGFLSNSNSTRVSTTSIMNDSLIDPFSSNNKKKSKLPVIILSVIILIIILVAIFLITNQVNIDLQNIGQGSNKVIVNHYDTNYCKNTLNIDFDGITAIASMVDNNTSIVQSIQSKPEFILIYDSNKFLRTVRLDESIKTNQNIVDVLLSNNVNNFVVSLPLNDLAKQLKENSINCYKSNVKISLLTGEEEAIENYCSLASPDFKLDKIKDNNVIVVANSPDFNRSISFNGERSLFFLIFNNGELIDTIRNTFFDLTVPSSPQTDLDSAIKVVNEFKNKGATTVVLGNVSEVLENELKKNSISCVIKKGLISSIIP